jgi:acyl carrier protein
LLELAGDRGIPVTNSNYSTEEQEVMSIKQQVRQFILSNYLFTDDESKLADADSLMQSGTMDSTGILELIMFLEETFDIKVGDDEMIPANLDSVDNVVSFVERKKAA